MTGAIDEISCVPVPVASLRVPLGTYQRKVTNGVTRSRTPFLVLLYDN